MSRNNQRGSTRANHTGELHMQMKTRALGALGGLLLSIALTDVAVAADRPYTEGAVVNVASIRTEPGKFDDYMAWLAGPYKQAMEAEKAAGVILDYSVYLAVPRSPGNPDLYLITVYKNMAALDGLRDKTDPIQEKLFGNPAQRSAKTIERGKMRTVLGNELMRKLELK